MEHTLQQWRQVPDNMLGLIKEARPIQQSIKRVIRNLPAMPGYGHVYWHPRDKEIWYVLGDSDDQSVYNKWENALKSIRGVSRVRGEAETGPPDRENWVLIKQAFNPLGLYGMAQRGLGRFTGGPSPLTNALAGALLTGGLGYGTGWLLERLFPERFVDRGRLSRTLGGIGAAAGAVPGMWQWHANNRAQPHKPQWSSLWQPNANTELNPQFQDAMRHWNQSTDRSAFGEKEVAAAELDKLASALALPDPHPLFTRSAEALCKMAFGRDDVPGGMGGVGLRPVPLDAFGAAIWNDVRAGMTASKNPYGSKSPWGDNTQNMHTPPAVGAATAGLVAGLRDMYGGQSVLSPRHFVNGLATAGVDVATAHLVGGTLGALGGLTPVAQKKIQDVGLWGGLLRGTVGSLLGMQ